MNRHRVLWVGCKIPNIPCDVGFIRSPLNSAHPEATVMSQAACDYSCLQICSSSAVDDVTRTLQTQFSSLAAGLLMSAGAATDEEDRAGLWASPWCEMLFYPAVEWHFFEGTSGPGQAGSHSTSGPFSFYCLPLLQVVLTVAWSAPSAARPGQDLVTTKNCQSPQIQLVPI